MKNIIFNYINTNQQEEEEEKKTPEAAIATNSFARKKFLRNIATRCCVSQTPSTAATISNNYNIKYIRVQTGGNCRCCSRKRARHLKI